MKVLIASFAFVAVAMAAVQDSTEPTDLEVRPDSMSPTCKAIFAPLQVEAINNERDKCKLQYPKNNDLTHVQCKDRCILEWTGFVDKDTKQLQVFPFMGGIETMRNKKGIENEMINRTKTAFQWCFDQAEKQPVDPSTCANPVYTEYGLCMWEMVKKLCSNVFNNYSDKYAPWGGVTKALHTFPGPA